MHLPLRTAAGTPRASRLVSMSAIIAIGLAASACAQQDKDMLAVEPAVEQQAAAAAPAAPAHASLGEAVYQRACASCHDGGALQAPLYESLVKLSSDQIMSSLTTGVMASQALSLSLAEKEAVSLYISQTQSGEFEQIGLCADSRAYTPGPVDISDWGMGARNWRAVDEDQTSLNADNAASLELAWVFAFPQATRARVQPTLSDGVLFTADQTGRIFALDAETGCTLWTVQTESEIRSPLIIGSDANGNADRLFFGDLSGNVHALDLATRERIWTVRADEHPQTTITGAMRYVDGRLYVPVSSQEVIAAMNSSYECCTFRGSVLALNAATGEQIWKTMTITEAPSPRGTNSAGATLHGPAGAPVWSTPTIDTDRGLLYVGTGENYSHPASAMSDAILAMDLDTGRIVWSYQATADDVWNAACPSGPNCPVDTGPDYDFGAPPVLVDLAGGGSLLLAGQKSGDVYALDPDNGGRLVWQAKPGRGGIMGGVHWGMTTDGETLFVPISDLSVYPRDAHLPPQSGVHALQIGTGEPVWSTVLPNECGDVRWRCSPGVSAAATYAPGVILGGSLDGMLRAFSAETGDVLWSFNTNQTFEGVNGLEGEGGGIDSSGPVVSGRYVYATSGYDKFGQKGGNLLFAFRHSE